MNENEKRLCELWGCRPNLTRQEWEELATLVYATLDPSINSRLSFQVKNFLRSLPDEPSDYIQSFFLERGLCGTPSRIDHPGGLVAFFFNFLRDAYRKLPNVKKTDLDDNSKTNNTTHKKAAHVALDSQGNLVSGLAADSANYEGELTEYPCFDNSIDNDISETHGLEPNNLEGLIGHVDMNSKEFRRVVETAKVFLQNSKPWVRLYLRLHYLADDDERIPMDELRRRYQIRSHHYKAQKLGAVLPKTMHDGDDAFFEDYGKNTMLGIWLTECLDKTLKAEYLDEVLYCLKILGAIALTHISTDGEWQ